MQNYRHKVLSLYCVYNSIPRDVFLSPHIGNLYVLFLFLDNSGQSFISVTDLLKNLSVSLIFVLLFFVLDFINFCSLCFFPPYPCFGFNIFLLFSVLRWKLNS